MNASACVLSSATGTLRNCVAAAVRAPSGDNTQPWRFEIDAAAACISVFVDESRDPSPMNAGQTMARIACGAAVENMLLEASAEGWNACLEEGNGACVATIRLAQGSSGSAESKHNSRDTIRNRTTNRRLYDGRSLSPSELSNLTKSTPILDGVRTHWFADRGRIDGLARLIGAADGIMFGERSMRNGFLSNIRFDCAPNDEVSVGLPLASLELSTIDRYAMRAMPHIPTAFLKATGGLQLFSAHAGKLVRSASGICLLSAPKAAGHSLFRTGRAMQRAWLGLTELGMAAQPMMSLLVLANALDHGTAELIHSLRRERIEALLEQLRSLLPELSGDRPMFLMRFGFAPAPSGRTGRLKP